MDYRRRINRIARNIGAAYTFGGKYLEPVVRYMPKRKRASSSASTVVVKRSRTLGASSGRSIYRQPKAELKVFDVAEFSSAFRTPLAATSLSPLLNVPVSGSDVFNRVGRKIYMKSLQIKGLIFNNNTSIQDSGRMLLIFDSQPNAAAPTVQNLLSNFDGVGATNGNSMINLNNRQRFLVLRDHQIIFPGVNNAAGVLTNVGPVLDTGKYQYEINWFVKLKGLETIFNQINGGTIADIASGSLYLIFVSTTQDAGYNFKGNTRLRYYD